MGCFTTHSQTSYITILGSAAASAAVNINTTCDSTEVFQFTGSPAAGWLWHFGDGSTSTQQNPSHVYGQSGTFNAMLIATSTTGCADTVHLSTPVVVKSNPKPEINIVSTTGQCVPAQVVFGATLSGNPTCDWDFGDTTHAFTPGPVGHYYNIGTYVPILTVTYSNGCVNADTLSPLTFYSNPVPYFAVGSQQGCVPHTTNFTPFGQSAFSSFSWDFGDGSTSALAAPSHTYTTPGSFTVSVVTTTSNGCVNTWTVTQPVEVTALDAVFTADDLSGCMPHTVNFSYPGNSGITYLWDFGDGSSSVQMSPAHIYTANGNYTVTLTVTDNNGCTATYSLPAQVQVTNGVNNFNPAPPVTACAPFTINLYDNSPATNSWNWDFGDGSTSTNQNPTHTYMVPGTYHVSLTTGATGSNCSQFVSPYRTYIIKGGIADFDVTQTLCPPYTATFTDQSTNAVAWFWDFGDGTTSTLQHPVHVYPTAGNYNVTLTITTADGCVYEKVHNYAVTFLPLTANATATTTDSILPMNVQFFANSSGATMWFWDFGDGGTSTQMNPVHLYTTPGPYNITLTISNPGCTFTYIYTNVSVGAGTIIPGGPPDSLHVPDPVFSCIPYEMNFNNPVQNTVAWLWDFGDGDTSTVENPIHIFTDPGSFTVTLITWDAFGNTDTVVQPSSINLVGAKADFDFSFLNNCQGSSISTTNNSTNAVSYFWDFGDGTTSTAFEPNHTYSTTGVNYIVALTVTDSGGCTDFMSRSYYAAVNAALSADKRKSCAGDTVFFDSGTVNFASYLWDFGDGSTSSQMDPWHIYSDSGSYQVSLTVTDTAGCVTSYQMPYQIKISKPVADFYYVVQTNGCAPVNLQLTNLSTGADSWVWNFGNGVTSSQFNPVAVYPLTTSGSFNVTLTAIAGGCADSLSQTGVVYIPDLVTDFSYVQSSQCFPVTVTYTDLSTDAVSWHWEFGDGTTSNLQHPVHVFNQMPSGPVRLTATDALGCQLSKQLTNIQAMIVDFTFSDSTGCKPFVVSITDSSSGVAAWNWSFGDGTYSSQPNPQHTYTSTGNFAISLTATSTTGCMQIFNPAEIITVTGPQASFSSAGVVSCAPTIVNFTDLSTGAGTWLWSFGDGGTSVVQHPVHIYNQPGNYDVSLVITDSIGCSDSLTIPEMVHITGSVANFTVGSTSGCSPWQVSFQDASISAFTWLWNFGDGTSSTNQHPNHTYTTPGAYVVTLVTHDTTGCQSVYSAPTPVNVLQPPVADFSTADTLGCAPYTVNFSNLSLNAVSWNWDFGDGNTSVLPAPQHVYNQPGTYPVTLVVFSADGCSDTIAYTDLIKVGQTPQPAFTAPVTLGCPPLQVQFTNNSTGTEPGSVYLWTFGNGTVSSVIQPHVTYNQPGIYDVSLQVSNAFGCSAFLTAPAYIQVTNDEPLPPVNIRSVSVVDAGSIDITWANLAAQNLASYEVFRYNTVSNNYDLIYTEFNPSSSAMNVTSVYRDSLLNTTDYSYTYVIRAVNTCGVATMLSALTSHSSLNVEAVEQGGYVDIAWNAYGGCPVNEYEIARQDYLNGPFNVIGTVSGNVLSFTDTSVYCSMLAAYRIRATDLCGLPFDAFSDTSVVQVPGTIISQPVDVVRSTVVDDRFVLTEWAPPALFPQTVSGYEIYRSDDGVNFSLLDVVPAMQTSYADYQVNVHADNYFYRIKVVNICQLDPGLGNMGASIWLQTDIDDENISRLRWTRYEDWNSGVDYYIIERMDTQGVWRRISTVPGTQTDYTDR